MTKLYFAEKLFKLENHYPIVDENDKEKYYLDQGIVIAKYKSDVSHADGSLAMTIERPKTFGGPEYLVTFANGSTMTVKKPAALLTPHVEAEVNGESLGFEGDVLSHNLDIKNGAGNIIGGIRKETHGGNIFYTLFIDDESYEEILVGIGISIANMVNMQNTNAGIIGAIS